MKRKREPVKYHWMKLDFGKYLARTSCLRSAALKGAYMELMVAYRQNGPFVDDDRILMAKSALTAAQWARSGHLLKSLFTKGADGRLHQADWEEDIAEADRISAECRRSAAQRKPKPQTPPVVIETPVVIEPPEIETPPEPTPEPTPEPQPQPVFGNGAMPDRRFSVKQVNGYMGQVHLRGYDGIKHADSGDPSRHKRVAAGIWGHNQVCLAKAIELCAEAAQKPQSWSTDWQILVDWLNEGIELTTILGAIKASTARRRAADGAIHSMKYFDGEVRHLHTRKPYGKEAA